MKRLEDKIACLTIPNFAIEIYRRDHPETDQAPLALAESELEDAVIVAMNEPAAAAGLLLNLTVAQGRILCADLNVRTRDIEREIEQSNQVYKKLQSVSPFVEEAAPGLYFLDASGLELLYPNDHRLAAKIISTIKACTAQPYPCRVGIGRNKLIAQLAAEQAEPDSFMIVPRPREKKFLHPLPLTCLRTDTLRLTEDTLDSLHDLGLRRIGQVAAFPANELIRRFGPRGEALACLAAGNDPTFFTPETMTETLQETLWLDHPVNRTATIVNLIERLLVPLLKQLSRYSHGCSVINLKLYPDRKSEASVTLTITVEQPTLSLKIFLRQLGTQLEQNRLTIPVTGLKLTIPVTTLLLSEQLPLTDNLQPPPPTANTLPDRTDLTVPLKRDLFLPEQRLCFASPSQSVPAPALDPAPIWSPHCLYTSGRAGSLRLCRPAREVEVTVRRHKPVAIRRTKIDSRGPWELSGQWWSHDYDRHYWEVHSEQGRHFLIYQDRLSHSWFLQGIFD